MGGLLGYKVGNFELFGRLCLFGNWGAYERVVDKCDADDGNGDDDEYARCILISVGTAFYVKTTSSKELPR